MLHVPGNLVEAYPMWILEDKLRIVSYNEDREKREQDGYWDKPDFLENDSELRTSASGLKQKIEQKIQSQLVLAWYPIQRKGQYISDTL
jgi:hypothetical protein